MATTTLQNYTATGSSIESNTPIVFEVRTDGTYVRIVVLVEYAALGFTDTAYLDDPGSSTAFLPAYSGSTVAAVTDPGFTTYRFSLLRGSAWPSTPEIRIIAYTDDGAGELNTTLDYILLSPPTTDALSAPAYMALPPIVGGSVTTCPLSPYTQAELLTTLERAFPHDYITPIKLTPNAGYEVFQAAAKVMARVSEAVIEVYCCALLAHAQGGLKATGTVEFFRTTLAGGAVTIAAGSRVRSSRTHREFVTLGDAVFGSADLGPVNVTVQAVTRGPEYNLPGQVTTAGGEVIAGEIDTIWRLFGASPKIDPNMQVRQIVATTGGRADCLDGWGNDVLIPRQPLESDGRYRLRIRETPDTVSPDAIRRGLDAIFDSLGLEGCLREVGTSKFPGFFLDAGSSDDSPQVAANNYAYDMDFTARPEDRFKLLVNYEEMRAFFLVGVPTLKLPDFGLLYDTSSAVANPVGNAYDTVALDAQNAAYDGFAAFQAAVYKAVYDMVDAKRAGGVGFALYLEDISCV